MQGTNCRRDKTSYSGHGEPLEVTESCAVSQFQSEGDAGSAGNGELAFASHQDVSRPLSHEADC